MSLPKNFKIPDISRKIMEREAKKILKPIVYNYTLIQKYDESNEQIEHERIFEDIHTAITSKLHGTVVQWFSKFLRNEARMRAISKTKRESVIVTPNSEDFSNAMKDGISTLLKFINLEPTEKVNVWKIPINMKPEALVAKWKYLDKLIGSELFLSDIKLDLVSDDPEYAKLIFDCSVDDQTCKCKFRYSKLLMHISRSDCKQLYNEEEIKYLKEQSKWQTKVKAHKRYEKKKEEIKKKYQENKESIQQMYKDNRAEKLAKQAKYYSMNKDTILVKRLEHYAKNRKHLAAKRAQSKKTPTDVPKTDKSIKHGDEKPSRLKDEIPKYTLKRKAIHFDMADLDADAEEEEYDEFIANVGNLEHLEQKRLPSRTCKSSSLSNETVKFD